MLSWQFLLCIWPSKGPVHDVQMFNIDTCLSGVSLLAEESCSPASCWPRRLKNIVVSRLPLPLFWASPHLGRHAGQKIWAHSTLLFCDCALQWIAHYHFSLHNNWPAVYPSVDWIWEARCVYTRLFAPFIWNQIVLLMLICPVMLAAARAPNLSHTHTGAR